jgi:methylmalonyl-CoA/ethylmalonyl-CoA epimerase
MKLHHVGIVVEDLDRHGEQYARMLGFVPQTAPIVDPLQKVKVQFWSAADQATIELIQPLAPDSPAYKSLAKGGGLNHLGFEVDDVSASVSAAVANGAICTCPAVPATGFGGRQVAFVFYRHIGLVEFVEAER